MEEEKSLIPANVSRRGEDFGGVAQDNRRPQNPPKRSFPN